MTIETKFSTLDFQHLLWLETGKRKIQCCSARAWIEDEVLNDRWKKDTRTIRIDWKNKRWETYSSLVESAKIWPESRCWLTSAGPWRRILSPALTSRFRVHLEFWQTTKRCFLLPRKMLPLQQVERVLFVQNSSTLLTSMLGFLFKRLTEVSRIARSISDRHTIANKSQGMFFLQAQEVGHVAQGSFTPDIGVRFGPRWITISERMEGGNVDDNCRPRLPGGGKNNWLLLDLRCCRPILTNIQPRKLSLINSLQVWVSSARWIFYPVFIGTWQSWIRWYRNYQQCLTQLIGRSFCR